MMEVFRMKVQRVRDLMADRKGISTLEYGLVAGAILAAVSTSAIALGGQISTLFADIVTRLTP